MKLRNLCLVAGTAIALATTSAAETVLRLHSPAPPNTPWVAHLEKFADAVAETSNGAVKIELYPGSQLGPDSETIRQVARGRIDMGFFPATSITGMFPELDVLSAAYLWDSYEQADCAFDTRLEPAVAQIVEAKGMKVLQFGEIGFGHIVSKTPRVSLEDMADFKARSTGSASEKAFWDTLGSSSVSMSFAEWPSAMQTGLVEGGTQATIAYVAAGIGKIAPHMTRTAHLHVPAMLLVSSKVWDELGQDGQAAIMDGMVPAGELRSQVRGLEGKLEQMHVGAGGTIHEQSEEQRAEWVAAVEAQRSELLAGMGASTQAFWTELEAAKAACSE